MSKRAKMTSFLKQIEFRTQIKGPCGNCNKGLTLFLAGSALLVCGQIPVALHNPRELALFGPWFFYLAPTCTYRSSGIKLPTRLFWRARHFYPPQIMPSQGVDPISNILH